MAAASIISSVVTGGSNSHQTVAEELNAYATDFVSQGVVGTITSGPPATGGFAVTQDSSPDLGITVLSGVAYVSGTPSGQDAQVLRARMTSNYTAYTINANASGSTKYDWIYLQLSASNANNPSSAADNVITLFTSRSTSNTSDNGSPPTYGLLLAVVTVANGASSITNSNIADKRVNVGLSTVGSSSATGWNNLTFPLTYSANNGTKEFTVTTPNNLTSTLSPGMRLSIARSVTPPTQCMAFVSASSQYATKASPSGITFTGAFTCEAWVYLQSYTGQQQFVIGRTDNSTGGFALLITASGQPEVIYGASSNFTSFASYQSLPLNRWVHVACVVTSVSGKTGAVYINGALVPSTSPNTAATTLTQTSNLTIGAAGTGAANTFFNGYISEARVWSTNQTQSAIQSNMAINLVGNETNLVALFQGNGAFTDATSNANNLTANAGAIATQANNPYHATEYALVTNVSYVNPTTTLTLFTGTDYVIPNQTLNSPQYATTKTPLNFPSGRDKWIVDQFSRVLGSQSSPVQNTWYNINNNQLSIPTGEWQVTYISTIYGNRTSGGNSIYMTLSTANNSETDRTFTGSIQASPSTDTNGVVTVTRPLVLTSQTFYYKNMKTDATGLVVIDDFGDRTSSIIVAESAWA